MGQFGMGQAVRRTEDSRLLTGGGRYIDDVPEPAAAIGFVLRSPHAHARILGIETAAARAVPGVVAVYTAADLAADGVGPIPAMTVANRDGSPAAAPPRLVLATDRVRHVGDQVAFIVAETMEAARDAAELVEVDYEALASVTDTARALEPGQPLIWDDVPANIAVDWETGDAAAVAKAFAGAARVVSLDLVNNRVVVASMEPRGCLAIPDPATGRTTLHSCSQGVHTLRGMLSQALHIPEDSLRVATQDVGGAFGMKTFCYPETCLVTWAARKLGRPVRWTSDRSEAFLTDTQGRDHVTHVELALDEEGHFLAVKVDTIAGLGAYLSNFAQYVPTHAGSNMLTGVYRTPAAHVRVRCVFTNTTPVDAYRGAGRPEAAYVVERLVDKAARELGMDPAELRRRNFIPPEAMPFKTALGITYDSGEFARNLDEALAQIDRDGLAARRAAAAARGRLRGIGLSSYIEACGGGPPDTAVIRFDEAGVPTILVPTQTGGQGHATAYAQLAADRFGLPLDRIKVVQGDTDLTPNGFGTGGSRSIPVAGSAVDLAAERLIERGRRIAAHLLEAAEADIDYADGTFTIAGTDRDIDLDAVVRAAFDSRVPKGVAAGSFEETAEWAPPDGAGTYPNGTHAVEVEIDPDTGVTEIVRFVAVDDFGTVLNPLLLAGQVHGGVAQGVGQALCEGVVHDPDSGQPVTGSFMDYTLPRADHLPAIEFSWNVVPCRTNRLGIKGAGEAGAIGAPPAVINAIVDALRPYGITHIDMPATPQRIWETIQAAGA
ncbi:MAG TPA: xanthine dehydrogenase family protein molybdopterin-binding subunit [Stellaceae bacterium]|nr:xanthine dehydrogenase family protein molybdopterin-binding subunit [Stellaceae bacterium]